ncbi:MAG: Arm DNA-binding domain-containing protein, partial [Bacteroidales bacterium]|nr:Arm DNA-binding domain-containing protein [Bacteroidales bacterium]
MSVHKDEKRGTWYVRYRAVSPDGSTVNKCKRGFRTKKEARLFEESVSSHSITFRALLDEMCKVNGVRSSTIQAYNTSLNRFPYADTDITQVTKPMLMKWNASLEGNPSTCNKSIKIVRMIYAYANKIYDIANIGIVLKAKKVPKDDMVVWTVRDLDAFCNELTNPAYRSLTLLLFWTGLRIGEALALTWDDIDGNYLEVNKSIILSTHEVSDTKNTYSHRRIYVPDFVLATMEPLKAYKTDVIYPFPYVSYKAVFDRAIKRAGVPAI